MRVREVFAGARPWLHGFNPPSSWRELVCLLFFQSVTVDTAGRSTAFDIESRLLEKITNLNFDGFLKRYLSLVAKWGVGKRRHQCGFPAEMIQKTRSLE